ncbi:MAG: hypothetical protein NC089_02960 [Bacteroides sp.]|nr:hypothetical protein [Bacteroides sp.]MCM1550517.1 hypothetical protein [Clostridium sp.]
MDETQIIKAGVEVAKAPIEIIKIPFGGVSMAFQMSMSSAYGLSAIAQFGQAIKQKLDYEKAIGGADLKTLLDVSGGDIQVVGIPKSQFEAIKQAFIDYNIPHSLAPKINAPKKEKVPEEAKEDIIPDKSGEKEKILSDEKEKEIKLGEKQEEEIISLMFPTNATPRVNLILEKFDLTEKAEVETTDEYVQNANPEAPTEKLVTNNQTLSNIPVENPAGILTPDSIPPEQRKIIEQQQIKMKLADESKQAFSLNIEKLVISQDEESVLTRIPGTDNYVRFPKREAFIIDDNQTLLVFADKKAEVSVFDNLNQHIDTTSFERLHKLHYDRVAQMSRNRMRKAKVLNPQGANIQLQ